MVFGSGSRRCESEGKHLGVRHTVDMIPALTGRASRGIAKVLRRHGFDLVVPPESFLVTKATHLEPGEDEHARAWARQLGTLASTRLRFVLRVTLPVSDLEGPWRAAERLRDCPYRILTSPE